MRAKINTIRFIFFLLLTTSSLISFSQNTKVLVINIKENIDTRTSRYVRLGLEKANEGNYNVILIDMNTYGGTVLDADKIVAMLLEEKLPTYVYIDKNAGSAGSYIAIACDSIFMAPGSVMGASTVVNEKMEVMPEKIQSFMRKKMRSTAETNGRNPEIAEELVGINLQTDSAFVRVLTNKKAVEVDYCEGVFDDKSEIYKHYNFDNIQEETFELDTQSKLIAFFLNPAVKSILILLIFGGIYMEFKTAGIGVAAGIAIIATLLYFIPDYMHGLLANWEILVFIIGLTFIFLEIFVIPGFGITGVTGIIFIFSSLFLSMIQNDYFDFQLINNEQLNIAFRTVGIGFIGSMILIYFTASIFIKSKMFQKLILKDAIDTKVNISDSSNSLVGEEGLAFTVLRPSGKVKINRTIYDASSRGGFINCDEKIIVIEDSQSHLVVDTLD
jgi:membrane-bound serine protease (ClpP class)